MQPERHGRSLPINDHAYKHEESDTAEFRHAELRKRPTILRREVGQIVGELVEPVHA